MADERLLFNGLDVGTGDYLLAPVTADDLAEEVLAEGVAGDAHERDLELRNALGQKTFGVEYGRDPERLDQSGWGIVAAADADAAVLDALAPLCDIRRDQAGDLFQVFAGATGVQPGETKDTWLARHGVGPGPARPKKVPYYLLLVGGPESVPFRFQYELDVQHAVGRIAFDTPDEYGRYAEAVVAAESAAAAGGGAPRRPALTLFGPRNPDDAATALSSAYLLEHLDKEIMERAIGDCVVERVPPDEAKKQRLEQLVLGGDAPDLLFTASHGAGFIAKDARQRDTQGALVCGDWPGPEAWGRKPIPDDFLFAASDIGDGARVGPRVHVAFACFGAGTPLLDDFAHMHGRRTQALAERPFVARLPQRMLSGAGALAFVGHIDLAWDLSFAWPGAGGQQEVFTSTLASLLDGWRVGHAVEFLNERSAEIGSDLAARLNEYHRSRKRPKSTMLAGLWVAANDARGYAVLGDPAVRVAHPA